MCTGDGGGPLVCENPDHPNSYYLAGVIAGGIGCGTLNIPGLYVNVAKYTDWIDRKVTGINLDSRRLDDE